MEEEDLNPVDQSEFNAAIATLMRLDNIKKWLGKYTVEVDVESKYKCLVAYWVELDCVLSKEKRKVDGYEDKITEQEEQYNNYKQFQQVMSTYSPNPVTDKDLWAKLMEWEIELRRLEQKHNMNMPMGKDVRWALR